MYLAPSLPYVKYNRSVFSDWQLADGSGGWRTGCKGEGTEKCRLTLQNSHEDVKRGTGNIVSNTAVTISGPGGHWKYQGDTLESLWLSNYYAVHHCPHREQDQHFKLILNVKK